jgi:hypothetical protein
LYGDIIDFVNFRVETADSCLALIDAHHVGDALGLTRSLLEHYLLFILMCRGDKYFQLQDLTSLSSKEYRERLATQIADWEKEREEGKTKCIAVLEYPKLKRHIMYVFEGLQSETDSEYKVPLHYFQYQEFRPETMRLDQETTSSTTTEHQSSKGTQGAQEGSAIPISALPVIRARAVQPAHHEEP